MPPRNYPPAFFRYLKARLWNFRQPGFWGTAVFLVIIGLVVREYWLNPNILTHQPKPEVTTQPLTDNIFSNEDKAIAADIDNLPVLLNDFEPVNLSTSVNAPQENTQNKKSENFLEDVINKQNAAANQAKSANINLGIVNSNPDTNVKNPFVVEAENLLQPKTSESNNQFLGVKYGNTSSESEAVQTTNSGNLGIGLTRKTSKNQNPVLTSPLQAALNQSTNQQQSSLNNATSTPLNSLGTSPYSGSMMMPPTNNLPNQNLPASTGTGYLQPIVTNQPQSTYTNFNNPQVGTGISPVTSTAPSNFTPYAPQPPIQGAVIPSTPVGNNNYGNYSPQPPTQLPQTGGQNPNGNQGTGYRYP
jgi:hypothetical protein